MGQSSQSVVKTKQLTSHSKGSSDNYNKTGGSSVIQSESIIDELVGSDSLIKSDVNIVSGTNAMINEVNQSMSGSNVTEIIGFSKSHVSRAQKSGAIEESSIAMDSMVQSESMGVAIESAIVTQSNVSMTQSKLITKGQSRKK